MILVFQNFFSGGLSYLSHHYAMPFFLVHFPLLLLIRGYMDRNKECFPWKKVLMAWAAGVTGFVIIASVWVCVLSTKYGNVTISPKGGIAHAIVGPADKDRRHPFFVGGLYKPRDPYAIHIFEDISDVQFETWSPFESKEYFIHQLNLIKDNAVHILNHFVIQSPFFNRTFVIAILALIPIALWLTSFSKRNKFLYTWIIMTFGVYCSGFLLLIARSPRRFYVLMLVFLLLSFDLVEKMKHYLQDRVSEQRKKLLTSCLFIIVIFAFALKPSMQLITSVHHIYAEDHINPYSEIADQINTVSFPSPYAIIRSSQKPTTDYYMAYFLNKPLLGRPLSADVQGITEELVVAGGKSLLVFDNPEITEELRLDGRYVYKATVKLNHDKRYEHAANWVVTKHEILTGWDNEVTIFTLKE